jgi:hypothetical protein
MPTKRGRLSLAGELVLLQLRDEARREADDDAPRVPECSPLDSAQARRAAVLEVI